MKKIALALVAFLMTSTAIFAQNKFEGIIQYELSSVGEVDVPLDEKAKTFQVFVYQNKAYVGNEQSKQLVIGKKMNVIMDLSQYISYLQQADVWESDYEGSGKIIYSNELTQKDIDSLTIPVTEGMYFEYIAGETKEISGFKAKKARFHLFNDEGKDVGFDIWYTDEIGPEYDMLLCQGLHGFPLEFVVAKEEGQRVQYKVAEITKGKVKNTDFMFPEGYEIIEEGVFEKLMKDIQDAMSLLQ